MNALERIREIEGVRHGLDYREMEIGSANESVKFLLLAFQKMRDIYIRHYRTACMIEKAVEEVDEEFEEAMRDVGGKV